MATGEAIDVIMSHQGWLSWASGAGSLGRRKDTWGTLTSPEVPGQGYQWGFSQLTPGRLQKQKRIGLAFIKPGVGVVI